MEERIVHAPNSISRLVVTSASLVVTGALLVVTSATLVEASPDWCVFSRLKIKTNPNGPEFRPCAGSLMRRVIEEPSLNGAAHHDLSSGKDTKRKTEGVL